MQRQTNPVQTFQPRYRVPNKKQSYWYSKSLDLRFASPNDLWGLERETLLAIKAELERDSAELQAQISATSARHFEEMERLAASRSLIVALINAAHSEIREAKKQRHQESCLAQLAWERAFVGVAKKQLTKDDYQTLIELTNQSLDPSSNE